MGNTTSINLGDHFKSFLLQLTKTGRYGSASEAVRAALRLLEEEETKYESLVKALQEGEASGDCTEDFDDIVHEAIVEYKTKAAK